MKPNKAQETKTLLATYCFRVGYQKAEKQGKESQYKK